MAVIRGGEGNGTGNRSTPERTCNASLFFSEALISNQNPCFNCVNAQVMCSGDAFLSKVSHGSN
jgi:hypothetical protein